MTRLLTLASMLAAAPVLAQAPAATPPSASPEAATAPAAVPPGDAPTPTPTPVPPPEPATATATADAIPVDRETEGRLVQIETHAIGVDPIVGRVMNRELRKAAEAMGYQVLGPGEGRDTMQSLDAGYPPDMASLWRVAYRARAERALFAVVWASGGRYVVQLRVANRDGTGPHYAQGDAGAEDLTERVAELLSECLAPPGEELPPRPEPDLEAEAAEGRSFFLDDDRSSRLTPRLRRLRLSLHSDSAFGIADDSFFNQLAGLRLDYRFGRELSLGTYLGYANLRGRDGRVSSLLPYVQLGNRVPVTPGGSVEIPLRVGIGYLVRNGMFLRLSAGLAVPLSDRVDLVFELLTPTFWLTPDNTLFSLDLGVEVAWKL